MSKEYQEEIVGRCLGQAYERVTGVPLTGNQPCPTDPPDRLFKWRGKTGGAELFELEQFHAALAFFDDLHELMYREVHERLSKGELKEVLISLPSTGIDLSTQETLISALKSNGATRRDVAR
jgi:hypothetical protein